MDDYIKREDAQRITAEWLSGYINDDERNVIEHIDIDLGELPPADVVEVVRCKDCKYWKELLPVCERIHRAGWGVNDFCSFGERAEDERIFYGDEK